MRIVQVSPSGTHRLRLVTVTVIAGQVGRWPASSFSRRCPASVSAGAPQPPTQRGDVLGSELPLRAAPPAQRAQSPACPSRHTGATLPLALRSSASVPAVGLACPHVSGVTLRWPQRAFCFVLFFLEGGGRRVPWLASLPLFSLGRPQI